MRDVEFLQDAGRNGWAVLTADQRIRWVPAELEVVRLAGVKVFALAGGNLTAADQAARYVANLERIQRACAVAGGEIYVVRPDRIERRWP